MARLVGSARSDNVGEQKFIAKAIEYFDDDHIIYWNRQQFGTEFDVCILIPGRGILVVELKGWLPETILRVENDAIIINTEDGEKAEFPQKQARSYRFNLQRYFCGRIRKNPLVFHMVSLPEISRSYFRQNRLDVPLEERFTFLKEDLESNEAFFSKIDLALVEANHWKRDPFDSRTMLEVRNLFETGIDLSEEERAHTGELQVSSEYDYSRFYYFSPEHADINSSVDEAIPEYLSGCKLYCVFSLRQQMELFVHAIDDALLRRGLLRNRDKLEITFDASKSHSPSLSPQDTSFSAFHCSFSILTSPLPELKESFMIAGGSCTQEQKSILQKLSRHSAFNAEQYFIEHAPHLKNIVVRAGAGTGKTYTMISRIAFVCYTQGVPLRQMAERIVMITFTNEAADQMAARLKAYFRCCYLLTSREDYLDMISSIDHMQISTIHSYAKQLIAQLGSSFGYGIDVGITSSEFYRRRKISDLLDSYIKQKEEEYGPEYTKRLSMPVYAIRESILDFISKLHNKSIDIASMTAADFGSLPDDTRKEVHELLAAIIPEVERQYSNELRQNNRIHLSSMMSMLYHFMACDESKQRIRELKRNKGAVQFLFVDEFQDTDDTQIDTLRILAELLDFKMFLVGDIKQCIYRFRGAKEKAFDQLRIDDCPDQWLEFSLRRNYRTDWRLLEQFDRSFKAWGNREDELLSYQPGMDKLTGTRDLNSYIHASKADSPISRYYRHIVIQKDAMRIPMLIEEIKRLQNRILYELHKRGEKLSPEEKRIAILVRENWQADLVRIECARSREHIKVQTNTGGDLYTSQPALDMMILANALLHFDEADYLYNLVTSNFFNLDIPKSNMYEKRMKIRASGSKAKADEKDQTEYLFRIMNHSLSDTSNKEISKWESIVTSLRSKPVLQVIREIYRTLEPWKNFAPDDPAKQRYYQLNVDLLFEQLISACNIDRLTISTLREHLYNCITSGVSVDSRDVASEDEEIQILCVTVHKAKGLEYGHVILPWCSAPIDYIKRSQLHISTEKTDGHLKIGYSLTIGDETTPIQNDYYNEQMEKDEKSREEARILYVAMTRAIRSFSWIDLRGKKGLSWQSLIALEE